MNPPPVPPPFPPQPAPQPPRPSSSNTVAIIVAVIVAGVVVLAIVAVLAAIAVPAFAKARSRAQTAMTISNARQLSIASIRMALDNSVAPDPALGWPGDLANSPTEPVTSLSGYVERLVEYKYLDRATLPKLFTAPGIPPYGGALPFDSKCSPFKVYRVEAGDPDDCLLLATRNFTYGSGLDSAAQPFGATAGIVCRKAGDAQLLRAESATKADVGRLPGKGGGGVETAESVLKM